VTEDEWREWYSGVLANLQTIDAGRLVASWRLQADRAIWAADGSPVELAESAPRPGFMVDGVGIAWRLPDGRVVRDKEVALSIAEPLGYLEDPTVKALIDAMTSGRATRPDGTGVRSRTALPTIARALLVAGLVRGGATLRAACRTWLMWEVELGGPLVPLYDPTDKGEARAAEDRTAVSVRRTLKGLGIQLRPSL
jgi:hypothetical protein